MRANGKEAFGQGQVHQHVQGQDDKQPEGGDTTTVTSLHQSKESVDRDAAVEAPVEHGEAE
eukprot:3640925-Prorocentrum_lima.AAC.1